MYDHLDVFKEFMFDYTLKDACRHGYVDGVVKRLKQYSYTQEEITDIAERISIDNNLSPILEILFAYKNFKISGIILNNLASTDQTQLFIKLTQEITKLPSDFNINHAINSENFELIKYLVSRFEYSHDILYRILEQAIACNNYEIYKLITSKNISITKYCILLACKYADELILNEIIDCNSYKEEFLYELTVRGLSIFVNKMLGQQKLTREFYLFIACKYDHIETFKILLHAFNKKPTYQKLLNKCAKHGSDKILKYLLELDIKYDLKKAFKLAHRKKNWNTIFILLSDHRFDFNLEIIGKIRSENPMMGEMKELDKVYKEMMALEDESLLKIVYRSIVLEHTWLMARIWCCRFDRIFTSTSE